MSLFDLIMAEKPPECGTAKWIADVAAEAQLSYGTVWKFKKFGGVAAMKTETVVKALAWLNERRLAKDLEAVTVDNILT